MRRKNESVDLFPYVIGRFLYYLCWVLFILGLLIFFKEIGMIVLVIVLLKYWVKIGAAINNFLGI